MVPYWSKTSVLDPVTVKPSFVSNRTRRRQSRRFARNLLLSLPFSALINAPPPPSQPFRSHSHQRIAYMSGMPGPASVSGNGVQVKTQDTAGSGDDSFSQDRDERKAKPLNRVPRMSRLCQRLSSHMDILLTFNSLYPVYCLRLRLQYVC